MGKFNKITTDNINDYIKYIILNNPSPTDAIYLISRIKFPNTDTYIGKYAGLYYETYVKYCSNIPLDKNFDKNAYKQNKNLHNMVH